MAGNRKLTVEILGDAKGLASAVGDANGHMSKLASGVGDFAKKAAVGLAAGAVGFGAFVAGGVKSLIEVERIGAQTDAVLKSTGGAVGATRQQIEDYASMLEKKTGIEAESIQSGQNLLLTFTNIRNGVGDGNDVFNQATSILTDMSVALGTDVSSSAVQLGKALNDPVAGVAALTKVGVTFDDQQKKQIKTLVESGKTMDAQKIILAELNKEFGGSAAAFGDTTAGKIAKLKNSFGDLQEKVAAKVLPAVLALSTWAQATGLPMLERLGDFLGKKLAPVFDEISGGVRAMVAAFNDGGDDVTSSGFAGFLERLGLIGFKVFDWLKINGPKALHAISDAIEQYVVPALKAFGGFLADKVWPAIKQTFEFMMRHKETLVGVGVAVAVGFTAWAVSAASAAAATLAAAAPVIAIGLAIGVLVAAVIYAYKHWGWFHDAVDAVARFMRDTLWPILKDIGAWIADTLVPTLASIATFIWEKVIPAIAGFVKTVAEIAVTLAGWVVDVWKYGGQVLDFFSTIGSKIGGFFIGLAETIASPFRSAFNSIAGLWNDTVGRLSFSVPDWVPGIGGKGWDVPDIPRFAQGGNASGWAIVGENGPELANFRDPARIYSNSDSRQLLRRPSSDGGAPMSVTFVLEMGGTAFARLLIPDLEQASKTQPMRLVLAR